MWLASKCALSSPLSSPLLTLFYVFAAPFFCCRLFRAIKKFSNYAQALPPTLPYPSTQLSLPPYFLLAMAVATLTFLLPLPQGARSKKGEQNIVLFSPSPSFSLEFLSTQKIFQKKKAKKCIPKWNTAPLP